MDWNVLNNKKIINYLIGDLVIKEEPFYQYRMPYMKGGDIIQFAEKIGKNKFSENKLSRNKYMSEIIDFIVSNNKIEDFFREILDLRRFRKIEYPNLDWYDGNKIYYETVYGLFNKINEELYFDKCHIQYDLETYKFSLISHEKDVVLNTEKIKSINKEYIIELSEQINNVIKNGDYESSITKSRTLVEEVIEYGIEKKGEAPSEKGDIKQLYNQFKDLYNMHGDSNMDKRINMLLSGFEKIITSIGQMRDKNSDSHAAGSKRLKIEEHHAILYANSALTMANFLLAVVENNK